MDDCAICLCALETRATLACGHFFHASCIQESGLSSPHGCPPCPLCREPVRECQQGLEALARYEMSGMLMGDVAIMEKAAALGSLRCAHELGNIYFDGIGVGLDPERGETYWKQSIRCFASCSRLAYMEVGRQNTEQAIVYFKKALVLKPTAASHMVKLAKLLGATDEADALFVEALALYADYPESQAEIYFNLGRNQVSRHFLDDAYVFFEQCLELKPTHARARVLAAMTSLDQPVAHAHVDYLLAANSEDVEAICLKARLHLEDNNVAEADRMLLLANQLAPRSAPTVLLSDIMRRFMGPMTRKRARQCSGL